MAVAVASGDTGAVCVVLARMGVRIAVEVIRVQQIGESAREQSFQSGEARAQDASVDLDIGPDRRQRVVPGDVRVVEEDEEGFEAEDRDDACADGFVSTMVLRVEKVVLETYKPPSPKTIISAIFWRFGSCSCLRKGNGRTATAKSDRILTPAFANLLARQHCF